MELTILEKISVFKKRFEKLGVPAEFYDGLPVCYGTDEIVDSLIKDLEEIRVDLKKESQEAFDLMNKNRQNRD